MKTTSLKILASILSILLIVSCEKEETNLEIDKKSILEELLEITNNEEVQQKAGYFASMLKNASIQIDDSSKVTVFIILDNPYIMQREPVEESFLKNHIVKGIFHQEDFIDGIELTAINGNKINIAIYGTENYSRIYLNDSQLITESETEVNGNIIHYIYSPIFANETDYSNYYIKTKEIFNEFIEYYYCFDAIFTDISPSINSSWSEIDNHTFNAGNEKIEKLWLDSYNIYYRLTKLLGYVSSEVFAEALFMRNVISSILFNYFGGIPIYGAPSEFYTLSPKESQQVVLDWIQAETEVLIELTNNNNLKNAAKTIKSRVLFQKGDIPNLNVRNMS